MQKSYVDYTVTNHDSIIKRWINYGASGWKLNVIDELPDEFIKLVRLKLQEQNKETVLIGDVWDDASNKVSYSRKRSYVYGEEIQSTTNYPLRESLINFIKGYAKSSKFRQKIMSLYENYPREIFYGSMNVIGTNDTERILTVLDGNIELLKLLVAVQFTLPGVPMICYGDEAGLKGGKEPDNRKSYPWNEENNEILDFYHRISDIRVHEKSLRKGDFIIYKTEDDIFAFERNFENEKIVVLVNVSNTNVIVKDIPFNGEYIDLFNKTEKYKFIGDSNIISISKRDFKILRKM